MKAMKYFILRQHPYFMENFRLDGWQEMINPKWISFEEFYKIPRRSVLTAEMGEYMPFPDIVITPFLLLSSLMMRVAGMYGTPFYKRDVIVVNRRDGQSKQYHMALLETIEREHILFGESHMFCMDIDKKREIIVSQDYAESVLRRGAHGIMLEEIDTREEYHYGKQST